MAIERADIVIRRLTQDDLPAAIAIQAATYPAFLLEGLEAFASRLVVPASYCLAAVRDGALVAYLLAHGWASEAPPPIGTVLGGDASGDILFIHDLAVSSAARGTGLGRRLVDHAADLAWRDGLRQAELIAVDGAAGYWRGLGFADGNPSPTLATKVAAYGAEARWMTRSIGSAG